MRYVFSPKSKFENYKLNGCLQTLTVQTQNKIKDDEKKATTITEKEKQNNAL